MFCFGCGHTIQPGEAVTPNLKKRSKRMAHALSDFEPDEDYSSLPSRKIRQSTCHKFGYIRGTWKAKRAHYAPYYDKDGMLVAAHLRLKDKDMPWLGSPKNAMPFGSQVWPKTGRKIVVTEGEIDALTMSQAQQNKWPVVSIGCGAGPQVKKYIAHHLEYFNNFDEVVIMFDNDVPGRASAKAAAEVIGPKATIATLPDGMKDPNEMLQDGRVEELVQAMWRAEPYRPEGIVEMSALRDKVMQGPQTGVPWPWETLTKLTYGRRLGEVYCLGAGTGIGKTDVFTEIVSQTVTELDEPVGLFFLEQHPTETAVRVIGKLAHQRFHVPDAGWTQEELEEAWGDMEESGKVFMYDSFGVNEWEVIARRMKYLYHAEGVKHFFLDHLTALAEWKDDSRKALEVIMADIGSLVKELNCCIYLISHLATPEGKPHEEGGRVMIRHFRGSRAIGFWCHFMFGLERNQQAADPVERHTTTFRILKDRYTGQATGELFYLGYDVKTGRLFESDGKDVAWDDEDEDATNSPISCDDFKEEEGGGDEF
jgi:twinkle protein